MKWDNLLTYDNFHLAWRRIRNSPVITTKDRLGLNVFAQALDVHIKILINDLAEGRYEPTSPSLLYLPKKSGRLRPFTLLHMRDRLVYQTIGNVLIHNSYEYLKRDADNKVFSPVLAGVDKDYVFYPSLRKGDDFEGQFLKFTKKQTDLVNSRKFTWVVQADIASFYPSIDHSLLIQKLVANNWLDDKLCDLLQKCLRVWSSDNSQSQVNKGLPIGYETSDLLANLFLNELNKLLNDQEYLRYVDDFRIYTKSQEEGAKLLNYLDIFLQKHGLMLQESKSSVREISAPDTENQLQNLEEQQILLSSIDRDINSPDQMVQEGADLKLRDVLKEVLGTQEWEAINVDGEIDLTKETLLFFAVYRIREKKIWLRDIVLELLISHSHRSYAVIQYLTLFRGDSVVVEKLWAIVDDDSKHGQVRANCLRALYKLTDDSDKIKSTIGKWIYDKDLSLSLCAIEVMQQYPDSDSILYFNLRNVIESEVDRHLLYAVVSTWFILLNSDDEKTELISWCLHKKDYMLNTLGVYFLSTNTHLLNGTSSDVSSLVEALVENFKSRVSIEGVEHNIRGLLNIQHNFTLTKEVLSALSNVNQFIINMILSRETNQDEYLRNLSEFLIEFSRFYQRITSKEFSSLIQTPELQEVFGYTRNGLANLSDFRSSTTFLGTKPALSHVDTEKLHKGISTIVSKALLEIESITKDAPESTKQELTSSTALPLPMIFFSYSHDDEKEREILKKKLKYLEVQGLARLWSDREIPAGQVWNAELDEKLNESIIVLFLITSNFMGSVFIAREEMPRAVKNYDSHRTVCIPILLEDCVWEFYPYKDLQALPKDALPITQWTRPDSAYKDIQVKVQDTLEAIKNKTYKWNPLPPPKL